MAEPVFNPSVGELEHPSVDMLCTTDAHIKLISEAMAVLDALTADNCFELLCHDTTAQLLNLVRDRLETLNRVHKTEWEYKRQSRKAPLIAAD